MENRASINNTIEYRKGIEWDRPDLNQRSPAPEAGIIPS